MDLTTGDYLIVFPQFKSKKVDKYWSKTILQKPQYSYTRRGVPLLEVFSIPPHDFKTALYLDVPHTRRLTGSILKLSEEEQVAYATPGRHHRGFLMFGSQPRIEPGYYSAVFKLGLGPDKKALSQLSNERYAVRLDFGSCEKNSAAEGIVVSGEGVPS